MGTLTIRNLTSGPINIQDLYITIQAGGSMDVERRWDELTAMFHLHKAIADGEVDIDFAPSEDERASGLVPVSGTAESEELDYALYVSPSGSDNNTGLSPVSPLLTVQAAVEKLPSTWGGQNRVFFAPGTYPISGGVTDYTTFTFGLGLGQGAEPVGFVGGFDSVLGDRTATAGTTGSGVVEDDTLSMTPDEYVGATLFFLSGAAAGARVLIASNTATTFSIVWDYGVAPGDTFRLERPNVVFESDTQIMLTGPTPSDALTSGLAMYGIRWNGQNGAVNIDGIHVAMEGCEFEFNTTGPGWTKRLSVMGKGTLQAASYSVSLPGIMSDMSFAAGISIKGGTDGFALTTGGDSTVWGVIAQQGGGQYISGYASYGSLTLLDAGINVDSGGRLRHVDYSVKGKIDNAPSHGIFINDLSRGSWIKDINISNCGGDAIRVAKMSRAYIQDVGGSGNAGHGVVLERMSSAWLRGSMTVTGTGGDVEVDGTTIDYATAKAGYTGTRSMVEGE